MIRIKVPCAINTTGATNVVLTPIEELSPNTVYYVTATTDVKSISGENLASEFNSQFTTVLNYMHLMIENSWPDSFDFIDWPTNDTYIYMSFDYHIDESSVAGNVDLLLDGTSVPCDIFVELPSYPTDIDIIPTENLLPGRTYTINIKTGLTGEGMPLDQEYNVNITTEAETLMTLTSSYPEDGDINIPVDERSIHAIFNYQIEESTIAENVFLLDSELNPVACDIGVGEGSSMIWIGPYLPLNSESVYTMNFLTGLQSIEGYYLDTEYNISFTTEEVPVMTLVSTDPAQGESDVALDKIISLVFDYPSFDEATFADNIDLLLGGVSVPCYIGRWPELEYRIMIKPSETHDPSQPTPLLSLSEYTIWLGTGLTSDTGEHLDTEHNITFTTIYVPVIMSLVSTDPENKHYTQAVPLDKVLTATFTKDIDPTSIVIDEVVGTVYLNTTGIDPYGTSVAVPFTTEVLDNVLSVIPTSDLIVNYNYQLTVTDGIRATDMENLDVTSFIDFRVPSLTNITMLSSVPESGTVTDFSILGEDSIVATFSDDINFDSVNAYGYTLMGNGREWYCNSSVTGADVTITPYGPIDGDTEYTLTFRSPSDTRIGVLSTTGNSLDHDNLITFITEPDSNYMWMTATNPIENQTGRPRNTTPTITFDMDVDSGTVTYGATGSVNLKRGSTNIAGSVSVLNNVITITPSALLNANSYHTFIVSTTVKSSTGKFLAEEVYITFRTGAT